MSDRASLPVQFRPSDGLAPRRLPAGPRFEERLAIQVRVISALMIRHVVARYGRGNLGFLWLFVEPMFLVGGVISIWTVINTNGVHGLSVAAFVLASYMPLTLWRYLSSVPRVMSSNYGLLYHRRITVFDIVVARSLAEIVGIVTAGVVVYGLLLSVGAVSLVEDPALLLVGIMLMSWFAFAAGCVVAGLSETFDIVEHLVQPVQYFLLPLSGCFFMVAWLPEPVRRYVLVVPLVHIYEIVRAGFYGRYVETHFSITYVLVWCAGVTAFGLWTIASARRSLSFR